MNRNNRNRILLLAFALLPTAGVSAATTSTIGFGTDGDLEGFIGINGSSGSITLTVAGGLLTATAGGGDPRLVRATDTVSSTPIFSKPAGETWATVVFRVRETDESSTVITTFDPGGLAVVLNSTNAAGSTATTIGSAFITASAIDLDGFFTVTADISAFTANEIRYFRFDPIGLSDAAGNDFEVDYVQINAVPEPTAALLGALGMLGLLRRRR